MRKIIGLFLLFLMYSPALFATAQIPDYLVIGENKYFIQTNPLESFFDENPELRPEGGSTALWRGYIATFEIMDDQLYVIDIEIEGFDFENKQSYRESIMHDIFPNEKKKLLTWFTGILVAPQGEMVNYIHMGYGSTYERYNLYQIIDGRLNEMRQYSGEDYRNFRKMQFKAFKRTEEYKRLFDESINDGYNTERTESFLYYFMIRYTSDFLVDLP